MPDDPVPATVPGLGDWLSQWLGFKIPTIPLLQTAKNLDKAMGRLITAGGANLASRIERDTARREARSAAETRMIGAASSYLESRIGSENHVMERAIAFSFGDSILKQTN